MSTIITGGEKFEARVPLLIIGAGAAGLCAALAAKEASVEAVVIERDAVPAGSTALSAGLIPAAATRFQRAKGISDSAQTLAADIQRKAHGEADGAVVEAVAENSAPLIEWLSDRYDFPFDVVDNFNYPGHAALRMHGLPSRTGLELIDRLRSAVETNDIVIATERAASFRKWPMRCILATRATRATPSSGAKRSAQSSLISAAIKATARSQRRITF